MEEKYIVVKGEAANHRNNVDQLDNTCNVCYTWADAYNDAMCYCYGGSRKAQIYKLEADLEVDRVTLTKHELREEREFTPDKY